MKTGNVQSSPLIRDGLVPSPQWTPKATDNTRTLRVDALCYTQAPTIKLNL